MKYSIKILKILFNKLVRRLYKTIYDKKNILNDNNNLITRDLMNNQNKNNPHNSCDLLNPKVNFG